MRGGVSPAATSSPRQCSALKIYYFLFCFNCVGCLGFQFFFFDGVSMLVEGVAVICLGFSVSAGRTLFVLSIVFTQTCCCTSR